MKFSEAYLNYESYINLKLKFNSRRTITNHFKRFILPYFKNYNIQDIREIDILNWQKRIDSYNYSYIYTKNIYISFTGFMSYAKKFIGLEKNVVSEVGFIIPKREIDKEMKYWTLKEYNKFIKKVDDIVYKSFFEFLFFTGCRVGEAIAVRFSDIKDGYISINKSKVRGYEITTTPKTTNSVRKIKLDLKLQMTIKHLKKYYITNYKNFDDNFIIFGGKEYLSESEITRKKNKACKLAGVKQIRLQDFRHSHITLLINSGIPVTTVAKRVGHKDITTTLNVYSHSTIKSENKMIHLLCIKNFFKI